jgi:undecaprenyl-diphosphatase
VGPVENLDLALLRLLRTRGHPPPVERAVAAFSRLGEHSFLWFAGCALGALIDRRRSPTYRRTIRVVATAEVVNALLKVAIARRRPEVDGLPPLAATLSNRSCPSAHATCSCAAARSLSRDLPAGPLYMLAGGLALSRPYLGVHYPSDTFAGLVLGSLIEKLLP